MHELEGPDAPDAVDFRFAPGWQVQAVLLALPNSPFKTRVTGRGDLSYAPPGRGSYNGEHGWLYRLSWGVPGEGEEAPVQRLRDSAVLVTTRAAPDGSPVELTALQTRDGLGRWVDLVRVRTTPGLPLELRLAWGQGAERWARGLDLTPRGLQPLVLWAEDLGPATVQEQSPEALVLRWTSPGTAWFALPQGWTETWAEPEAACWPGDPEALLQARLQEAAAVARSQHAPFVGPSEYRRFWESAASGLLQLREHKHGRWYAQPGASNYRGFWVLDGAFLNEALILSGHGREARENLELLLDQQGRNGIFTSTVMPLATGHWKETGAALWTLARHLELTGDRDWGRSVWPAVRDGMGWIRELRRQSEQEYPPSFPGRGLVPPGLGDGGLRVGVDYTNAFWLVGGLKAGAAFARYLDRPEASLWEGWLEEGQALLRAAMARDFVDLGTDGAYLPSTMGPGARTSATSGRAALQGQWGLMHAVFPLEVVDTRDPRVAATLTMLRAAEREGTCHGIGWLPDGIWTYAAGFWGLALARAGEHRHAREVLTSFMNHASPARCWREEQGLRGVTPEPLVGDMPHGWAWAMYLLLARNLLVLEEGDGLRLLHGASRGWAEEGVVLTEHPTRFGHLHLELAPATAGARLSAALVPDGVSRLERVWLHAPHGLRFADGADGTGVEGTLRMLTARELETGVHALLLPIGG